MRVQGRIWGTWHHGSSVERRRYGSLIYPYTAGDGGGGVGELFVRKRLDFCRPVADAPQKSKPL